MSTYFSLHAHSHASVLDGVSKPKDMLNRIIELGLPGCAITDHGTVSEAFTFNRLFLEAGKKPILGCEFYLSSDQPSVKTKENRQLAHLVVLAKNKIGWQNLIKAVSFSNAKENFYYKPRLQLEQFSKFAGNLLCFSGHPGSQMANVLFTDPKLSYRADTVQVAEQMLVSDWYDKSLELAQKYINIFGKENFYLEIQLIDKENLPVQNVIASCLREIGKKNNIPCISTADAHYCRQEDAQDQRVLLCTMLKTNFKKIQKSLDDDEEFGLSGFFKSNNYHIPSYEEMAQNHTSDEITNTLEIANKCETYTLNNTPFLPKFSIPKEYKTSEEYLTQLCRDGWRKKISGCVAKEDQKKYVDRIKYEIGVISEMELCDYFLIVQDYVNWAKTHGILVGPGRGCINGMTRVWSNDYRTKHLCDINKGDYVYTLDGSAQKVINNFEYKIEEELIGIRTYYGDIYTTYFTKDHLILSSSNQQDLCWKRSEDIDKNDWLFVPAIKLTDNQDETIDMSVFADGLRITFDKDFVYHNIYNWHTLKQVKKMPRYIKLTKAWYIIMGLFAGDGSFHIRQDYTVTFSLHRTEKNIVNFIDRILKFDGFSSKITIQNNCYNIVINNIFIYKLFSKLFNEYKCTSLTKHVPTRIFTANKNNKIGFIQGCLLSDGCLVKNHYRYKGISRNLIEGIRLLLLSLNIPSSIRTEMIQDKRCSIINPTYTLCTPIKNIQLMVNKAKYYRETYGGHLVKILKLNKTRKIDHVYDIEVENNANYLTSSFLVHNSAGGSLVSYLTNITEVDPVKYGLIFERFLNKSRKSKNAADIDSDFPIDDRHKVIEYIECKYGAEQVAQICTFSKFKGRGALKDVLRAHDICGFEEMNKITQHIPDEAAIADELQEMKEEGEDPSIILWALHNNKKELAEWCSIDEGGNITGPYARYFKQAIRLEGTIKAMSKHASALFVSPVPLIDIVPMGHDKSSDKQIIHMDMRDAESLGILKLDCLGLSALSKLSEIQRSVAL